MIGISSRAKIKFSAKKCNFGAQTITSTYYFRLTTSSRLLSDRQSQLNAVNAVNPEDFLLKRTSSNGQIEEQPIQNYYPGNNDGDIQKPNSNYLKNLVKQSVSIFVRSTCISIYSQCRSVVDPTCKIFVFLGTTTPKSICAARNRDWFPSAI